MRSVSLDRPGGALLSLCIDPWIIGMPISDAYSPVENEGVITDQPVEFGPMEGTLKMSGILTLVKMSTGEVSVIIEVVRDVKNKLAR